ncbi:MAG TPA: dethiobiotin synthase [Tepidisphaeraceae bacterium]|nr:dethiobiotin synthase [Tepidisphaeraceae bacterium]
MLPRIGIPGLFVTGTDTGVGKTVVAGAIARALRGQGHRVGVLKVAATGCVHRREGWVSEDAEFLAHCADAAQPLDVIAPVRYAEPLAPAVAAQRAGVGFDWDAVARSLAMIARDSDAMVVEGVGGIMVPLDPKHTVLDVAAWLNLPAVIVARAGLGTINHTLLTIEALRSRGVPVAGVVINRYPTDTPDLATETNPRAIEKWGRIPVLAIVPDAGPAITTHVPADVLAAIGVVDWSRIARGG